MIDWDLNIFLAEPGVRGRGLGQPLKNSRFSTCWGRRSPRSVFAYTAVENRAKRRALQKAGLHELGLLPHPRYPISIPEGRWLLYSTRGRGLTCA
jgi:RimJ/RimL family protein N-acetyltransferase